jgi:hypothetical protein
VKLEQASERDRDAGIDGGRAQAAATINSSERRAEVSRMARNIALSRKQMGCDAMRLTYAKSAGDGGHESLVELVLSGGRVDGPVSHGAGKQTSLRGQDARSHVAVRSPRALAAHKMGRWRSVLLRRRVIVLRLVRERPVVH